LGLPWVVLISGILHCNILQGNAHRIIANNQLTGAEHAEGYVDVTVGTGASLNAKFVSHPEATPSVENVTHATNGVMITAQRLKDSMGKPDRMEDLRKTITCNEFAHELLVGDEKIWTEEKLKELVKRVGDIDCHKPHLSRTPLFYCIKDNRYAVAAKLVDLGADPLRIVRIGGHWTKVSVFEAALLPENPVETDWEKLTFPNFSQAIKDSIDRKLNASLSPQRTREEFLVWNDTAWTGPYHHEGTPYWHNVDTGESSWTQPAASEQISTYRRFKQRVGAWSFFHHTPALTKDQKDKLPLFEHEDVRDLWKKTFDKKWWKGTVGK